ncbi:unnamed protein product [marine sediment metagenome]|uniref:Uncharacterized protein n=1 Tax=marine sediment metagenome TaxID=412755 RepID=X1W295_9ZZZZ
MRELPLADNGSKDPEMCAMRFDKSYKTTTQALKERRGDKGEGPIYLSVWGSFSPKSRRQNLLWFARRFT